MVYEKMDDFTKSLNEMLYYDHEEFWRVAAYNQGNKDGKKERNIEIARKMIQEECEFAFIMKITGLSKRNKDSQGRNSGE